MRRFAKRVNYRRTSQRLQRLHYNFHLDRSQFRVHLCVKEIWSNADMAWKLVASWVIIEAPKRIKEFIFSVIVSKLKHVVLVN